jgi:hypothetical protein
MSINIELSRRMAAVKVVNFYGSIIKDAEKELRRLHELYNALLDDYHGVMETLEEMHAAVSAEREACAQMVERLGQEGYGTLAIAAALRQGDKS